MAEILYVPRPEGCQGPSTSYSVEPADGESRKREGWPAEGGHGDVLPRVIRA